MSKANINKKPITTMGVVIPVEWDENGTPTAFAFSTYEEKEYLIDLQSEIGKKLSAAIKQKIRVTGTLGRLIKNRRVLLVESYEKLFSSADSRVPENIIPQKNN